MLKELREFQQAESKREEAFREERRATLAEYERAAAARRAEWAEKERQMEKEAMTEISETLRAAAESFKMSPVSQYSGCKKSLAIIIF